MGFLLDVDLACSVVSHTSLARLPTGSPPLPQNYECHQHPGPPLIARAIRRGGDDNYPHTDSEAAVVADWFQLGVGAFCSMSLCRFSSAQKSGGILACIEVTLARTC